MQRVEELEENFHHILLCVGSDQVEYMTMALGEWRSLGNPGCKLLKLRRDLYKVDLNCLSADSFHVLQNKNKYEDSNP